MDTVKVLQSVVGRLTDALLELNTIPDTDLNIYNAIADLECVVKKTKRIAEIYQLLAP